MSVSCECCVLLSGLASASSRSLVQRSPTDCGVSLSVIKRNYKPRHWNGKTGVGRRGRLQKKKKFVRSRCYFSKSNGVREQKRLLNSDLYWGHGIRSYRWWRGGTALISPSTCLQLYSPPTSCGIC
jgi:hypothetical protein